MANSLPGGEGNQGAFVASPGLIQIDGINPHPRPQGTRFSLAPGVRGELGRSLQSTLPRPEGTRLPKEGWCALAPGVRGEPGRAAQAPRGMPERGRGDLIMGPWLLGKHDPVDLASEHDHVDVAAGVFAKR